MTSRREFLHDSLAATAALSLLPAARHLDTIPTPGDGVSFDLHAHPGAFFFKGMPGYGGDSAVTRTVMGMHDAKLTGAFFSLVGDAPLLERTATGIAVRGAYAAGDGEREYQRQLAVFTDMLKTTPAFFATRSPDLDRAQREGKVAAFLACEGGEFLEGKPERVDTLHADGVRSLQLVHYAPNILGDLQTQPAQHGGLSTLGKAVVKRANAVGIVIDVAHAAFATVRDVASMTSAPIILSHSILKMDGDRPIAARAISVDHAQLVANTGGVIGAWPSGFNASFAEFVDNVKRLVDAVGIEHVGLGTDMDSNFKPVFDNYGQLKDLAAGLQARGLTRDEAGLILGGNMQRVLKQVIG